MQVDEARAARLVVAKQAFAAMCVACSENYALCLARLLRGEISNSTFFWIVSQASERMQPNCSVAIEVLVNQLLEYEYGERMKGANEA